MTPDPRLLLPATRELLEGWCGPGMLDNEPVLVDGDNGCVIRLDGTLVEYDTSYLPVVFDTDMRPCGTLSLPLSRAECRDRVCRVLHAKLLAFVPCARCNGTGEVDLDPDIVDQCDDCAGTGDEYRAPTPAELAAHLRTLPHAEQVAAIVALLRACPDAAEDALCCRECGQVLTLRVQRAEHDGFGHITAPRNVWLECPDGCAEVPRVG